MGRRYPDSDGDGADRPHLTIEEWHKAYPLARFICRTAVEAMSTHDLDYIDLVLYMLVATTCIEKLFASLSWTDGPPPIEAATAAGIETLSISRISLAHDSRLPRETVRRRVASLIEKGWLSEDGNGFLIVPAEHFFNERNETLFRFVFDEYAALQSTFERIDTSAAPRS